MEPKCLSSSAMLNQLDHKNQATLGSKRSSIEATGAAGMGSNLARGWRRELDVALFYAISIRKLAPALNKGIMCS